MPITLFINIKRDFYKHEIKYLWLLTAELITEVPPKKSKEMTMLKLWNQCEIQKSNKKGSSTETKQKQCTCILKTNKTVAAWSFTRKKFSFKTSDFALNQTSTRYFQSVSAHSTMSQEVIPEGVYLRICLYARWVFLHLVTLDQLSLLPLVCITPHKHGYRCRPSHSLHRMQ